MKKNGIICFEIGAEMAEEVKNTEVFRAALFPNNPIAIVDLTLAGKIGVSEAIVLQRIYFWTQHNQIKKISADYKDGYWWMYNSLSDFEKDLQGTIKKTAIHDALNVLERWGVIVVANYNQSALDKTIWYRVDEDQLNDLWNAVQDEKFKKQDYKGKDYSKEQLKEMKKRKIPDTTHKSEVQDSENERRYSESEHEIFGKRKSDIRLTNDNTKDKPETTKDELTKTFDINRSKEDINYNSLLTRLYNKSNKDNFIVDVIMYFYKRYEECLHKPCGKITDEKLAETFPKLKVIVDSTYTDNHDVIVRFLMDKYINDSSYKERNIYDFAIKMNDVYQKYIGTLWCDGEIILEEYAKNPYIEKKGA